MTTNYQSVFNSAVSETGYKLGKDISCRIVVDATKFSENEVECYQGFNLICESLVEER